MSLRDYFALVEMGATTMLRSELAKRLGPDAHAALSAASLVRAGRPAESWTCDQGVSRRCGREIVENVPGEAKAFLAVCEGSFEEENPCPAVPLSAEDLARETVSLLELTRALQRVYRLEGQLITAAALAQSERKPLLLGTDRAIYAAGCDVFFVASPRDAALALFLESRERATRSTRVLVPTSRRLAPEMATRYGAGARVDVEVLEDAIVVREGALVRAGRLRLVRGVAETPTVPMEAPQASELAAPSKGIAAEVGATAWEQMRITVIDGHTIRIQCGDKSIRRTYLELGFAGKKREPTAKWNLVLAIGAGRGSFRWKPLGNYKTVKNGISIVRKLFIESFGIEEDPFHDFSVVHGWRAKYQASSQIADE